MKQKFIWFNRAIDWLDELLLDKNSFLLAFFSETPPKCPFVKGYFMVKQKEIARPRSIARLEAMSKFSFCYHTVPLKKGKPMEGFHDKKQNENLRSREK